MNRTDVADLIDRTASATGLSGDVRLGFQLGRMTALATLAALELREVTEYSVKLEQTEAEDIGGPPHRPHPCKGTHEVDGSEFNSDIGEAIKEDERLAALREVSERVNTAIRATDNANYGLALEDIARYVDGMIEEASR